MNKERIAGTLDVIQGRAKRQIGRVTSCSHLRLEGVRDEVRGRAKQGYGLVKERVSPRTLGTAAAALAGFTAVALGRRMLNGRRAG